MTILVTGAGGFVGAHVVRALASAQPDRRIVATDVTPATEAVRAFWNDAGGRIADELLDVTDLAAVRALVARARPIHIVHAAALTPTPIEECTNAGRIVAVNVGGAANVLDAAINAGAAERVLVFSSGAVYGADRVLPNPIGEDAAHEPASLYGATKQTAERLAHRLGRAAGLSTVAVRVSAAYGAMERPTASRTRMSEICLLAEALRARRPVALAGPKAMRDWTHADDIGRAAAALLLAPKLSRAVYNVSCGVARSLRDAVRIFGARGLEARWVIDPATADIALDPALARPPLDIAALIADTGFTPAFTLETGIEDLLAHGARSEAA